LLYGIHIAFVIAANDQTFADMLLITLDALKHADEANAIYL